MRKIVLVLPLALLSLGSCEQNDPIRQKEREIEARKIHNSSATTEDSKDSPKQHSFEHWAKPKEKANYQLPLIAQDEDPSQSYWVSASCEGFAQIPNKIKNDPKNYPLQIHEAGYKGQAVSIRSVKGFSLFGMGTDVVAGSLYSGRVKSDELIGDALKATLFGKPWTAGLPLEMNLYYQYRSGKTVIHGQEGKLPEGIPTHDQGSMAGIFYETTEDATPLNGYNLHTDKRIVARAYSLINPSEPVKTWLPITLKFEAVDSKAYKAVNFRKKSYALAIVFSSSARGDQYVGAVGSELLIDELSIKTK